MEIRALLVPGIARRAGLDVERISAVRQAAVAHLAVGAPIHPVRIKAIQPVTEANSFWGRKAEGRELEFQRAQIGGETDGRVAIPRTGRCADGRGAWQ